MREKEKRNTHHAFAEMGNLFFLLSILFFWSLERVGNWPEDSNNLVGGKRAGKTN